VRNAFHRRSGVKRKQQREQYDDAGRRTRSGGRPPAAQRAIAEQQDRHNQRHDRADDDRDVKLSAVEHVPNETFVPGPQADDHGQGENHFAQPENAESGSTH
jgi:hypothetical protein